MQAVELPLETVLYPLGYPLRIATNSPEILRAAEQSWGRYPKEFSEPELHLRIVVCQDTAPLALNVPTCRAQRHLVINVADDRNFSVSDLARGFGFCMLTSAVAAETGYTRYHFLESMVYNMLAYLRLTPIHAACVALDGRGVLLFGPAASGKSCLTFACAKRGWIYVADDSSALVRGREESIILGKPYRIRFRESAADLFPELEGLRASAPGNGEPSIEIETCEMPGIRTAASCRAERLVFLDRVKAGPALLTPLAKEEALRLLEFEMPMCEPRVYDEHKATFRTLVKLPTFTLRYSDLDSAIGQLHALLK